MKRLSIFTINAILTMTLCTITWGQVLFTENFDYPVGDTLSHLGWEQIRNGDSLITITEPGLFYEGYCLSGIGNAAHIRMNGGQEIRNSFSSISSDSVYFSFLIKVNDATVNTVSADGLFLYLTPPDGSIFAIKTSVYVRKHESSNLIAFGVSKGGGVQFTNYEYSLGITYLIVVKYKFDNDNPDKVSLWINPAFSLSESEPTVSITTGTDIPEIANIIISQLIGSNAPPNAIIDGIQITTNWSEISTSIKTHNPEPAVSFLLNQNYPNPFNPITVIKYQLPVTSDVRLTVYNILGQIMETLIDEKQSAGNYQVKFDGSELVSGVYFYELRTNYFVECKRMLLFK
ncbi:MAG: T9SS type A sorting domain-containing protein [Calditrichaceae bacterium]|nr:T9SS type A sorting domain-containing protein [Calditrichaceae bacterium]MBN2708586.1 T9SS type A sorting domain-containing protein [Calditrichaceae bacterium]